MGTPLLDRLASSPGRAALLLDVDGTLAPIVPDPAAARVPEGTRRELERLRARYALVACVSGRTAEEAAEVVGLAGLRVIGEHGLSLAPDAEGWRDTVQAFATTVAPAEVEGLVLERKRLSLTWHYRRAADAVAAVRALEAVAERARAEGLVPRWGRRVLEVRPPIGADKGTAVELLLAEAGVTRALYAGDDETDLDAFRALAGIEVGVRVAVSSPDGPPALREAADLVVDGPEGLALLLRRL